MLMGARVAAYQNSTSARYTLCMNQLEILPNNHKCHISPVSDQICPVQLPGSQSKISSPRTPINNTPAIAWALIDLIAHHHQRISRVHRHQAFTYNNSYFYWLSGDLLNTWWLDPSYPSVCLPAQLLASHHDEPLYVSCVAVRNN